jgi:glycosyltransferase involved in cell wall biosynthesis
MHELIAKHSNLKFVIGGSSDAAEKKYIEELILNYGMSNHIILTGFILEDELPAHFLMSDLYIMPSNEEGFGLVFIEAMHYGLPVIAGNADGSVDALDHGSLGTLVDPGNIQHIQQGILKAIEQKGKNIPDRSILNKKFSFQTYKNQWHSLLNKCFTS